MTATNHALTGVLIGLTVTNPAFALPLAFVSHFALDAIPHFGNHPKFKHTSLAFFYMLVCDAAVASAVMLSLFIMQPSGYMLGIGCAIASMSPDLMWFPAYSRDFRHQVQKKRKNIFTKFHSIIQWSETPRGVYVEVVWFFLAILQFFKSFQ